MANTPTIKKDEAPVAPEVLEGMPEKKKSKKTIWIIVIVVAVLLLCCCLVASIGFIPMIGGYCGYYDFGCFMY